MDKYTPLIGRICLSAIFIKAGIDKIIDPAGTTGAIASKGIPLPGVMLVLTIIVLLLGGVGVLIGYKTRISSLLLVGFLIPTTLLFHGNLPTDEIAFLKNLGLMGGLLMLVSFGAGSMALDNRT